VVDGKYVAVKGCDEKIPLIYGMDYTTHDIPICLLAPSENYQALLQFFKKLRNTGYELLALICDDNESIRMAAHTVYSQCVVQLCHVHFLENIRRALKVPRKRSCSSKTPITYPFRARTSNSWAEEGNPHL